MVMHRRGNHGQLRKLRNHYETITKPEYSSKLNSLFPYTDVTVAKSILALDSVSLYDFKNPLTDFCTGLISVRVLCSRPLYSALNFGVVSVLTITIIQIADSLCTPIALVSAVYITPQCYHPIHIRAPLVY